MKNIIYGILGLFFLSVLVSCEEVLLDKEPIDIISDNVLWNDERLVEAYLDEVFHDMYFQLNECVRPGGSATWNCFQSAIQYCSRTYKPIIENNILL